MCLTVGIAPCLWIKFAYFSKKRKRLIWNQIQSLQTCIDLEEDWFPYQTGQTFYWTDQWYFSVSRQSRHLPRYGIWNQAVCLLCQHVILSEFTQRQKPSSMPTLSACNIIRIYSKAEDYEIENKTRVDTEYEWKKMAAVLTSTSSCY